MTRQIAMEFGDGLRAQEVVATVDAALVELVTAITSKEASWRLDVAPATLHKKLYREDRHQLSLREAVILMVTAPELHRRAVLEVLADACGFAVIPTPDLNPSQVLERLLDSLADLLSPKQMAELVAHARGRGSR